MKEYKVEYEVVKKEYWRYTVEAKNRQDAIEKVRTVGLDVFPAEDHEVASQSLWTASNNRGFLDWVSSIFKG